MQTITSTCHLGEPHMKAADLASWVNNSLNLVEDDFYSSKTIVVWLHKCGFKASVLDYILQTLQTLIPTGYGDQEGSLLWRAWTSRGGNASPLWNEIIMKLGEAVKNYLADFFPLRGGVPPLSAMSFWQNDFLLMG